MVPLARKAACLHVSCHQRLLLSCVNFERAKLFLEGFRPVFHPVFHSKKVLARGQKGGTRGNMLKLSPAEKKYIVEGVEANLRSDGRARQDFRYFTIETGVTVQT